MYYHFLFIYQIFFNYLYKNLQIIRTGTVTDLSMYALSQHTVMLATSIMVIVKHLSGICLSVCLFVCLFRLSNS